MKVAKAIEIANLTSGQVIGEITGKIKKVFPPKTGQGNFGPWSVQNVIIQDETGEVRAGIWNIPMGDLEGAAVTFKSSAGKNGLAGITVAENRGKNELKITEKCIVIEGGAQRSSPAPASSGGSAPSQGGLSSKERIFQNAQLMVDCIKAAGWVKSEMPDEVSAEHFQAICSSLFISAERAGLAAKYPSSVKKDEPVEEKKPDTTVDDDDLGW